MAPSDKIEKWDIYLAKVSFEDNPDEAKIRPVVISSNGNAFIVAFYTTSQSPKPGYPCYTIKHWQQAGLNRQSNIRLDKAIKLPHTAIISRIGRLTDQDIMHISLELAILSSKRI